MTHPKLAAVLAAAGLAAAAPAAAQDYDPLPPLPGTEQTTYEGEWQGEWVEDDRYQGEWTGTYDGPAAYRDRPYYDPATRDAWLDECRSRDRDSNIEGAIIGGVIGGIAGNRIAGEGNRRIGTVVGGVVGAAAGAAIDSAEGGYADECEAYLDRYMASGHGGYGYQSAYGYGHSGYYAGCGCQGYMATRMVPITTYRFGRVEYAEDIFEEEIEETVMVEDVVYETVREEVAPEPTKRVEIKTQPTKRLRSRK
ncbi:glycine zipper 2TM domain-containing protein [Alteriqipengyuania flavescens]|uniref:glycine zipper 2TM domain-containing protein n=1 Tax=Alteriqipengyuania flavescens TaxID=3053610 RepID=UPI0025B34552|nr:glycine zipper 2TM domain-containing protein [Alteriqipengyuania flavescens]WJY19580.1 glycine zipper 2TM domain-containing protein [Alteriqipengyuania flavescens]WJY25520.1 glycine zipper 2TM domain-containing protein [Alteriqipengyuania flavescens]